VTNGTTDNLGIFAALATIGAFIVGVVTVVGTLIAAAIRDKTREARLLVLVQLRKTGVVLRNHGQTEITSAGQFKAFQSEFDKWHASAIEAVTKLSAQEGENFKTLDKWDAIRDEDGMSPTQFDGEKGKDFAARQRSVFMLTAWLRVLNEVRERYSR
jgi:hypothetical protein